MPADERPPFTAAAKLSFLLAGNHVDNFPGLQIDDDHLIGDKSNFEIRRARQKLDNRLRHWFELDLLRHDSAHRWLECRGRVIPKIEIGDAGKDGLFLSGGQIKIGDSLRIGAWRYNLRARHPDQGEQKKRRSKGTKAKRLHDRS